MSYHDRAAEQSEALYKRTRNWVVGAIALTFIVLATSFAGCPQYNKWRKDIRGQASLAEAQHSKQVQVEEAKANLLSERLNAKAEVERAKGAAEAIRIEGGKLTDEYIKYLWVRQQKPGAGQVIYVPTEAGLPILEAGKR